MLRDDLRAATRPHHERIERTLDIRRSLTSTASYVQLLQRFYGFYVPVEARLMQFRDELHALGIDVAARRKAEKLRDDLREHGLTVEEIDATERCPDIPRLHTPLASLGCLYVLEGSTLGGQVIAHHLERTLQLRSGMSFYRTYGADTGRMWRSFVTCLNAIPLKGDARDVVVEAAQATFESLERWAATTSLQGLRRFATLSAQPERNHRSP